MCINTWRCKVLSMSDDQVNPNKTFDHNKNALKTNKKVFPQVRQTLTSKYRLLKANPLLMYELGKKLTTGNSEEILFTPLKTLAKVLDTTEIDTSAGNPSYLHRKSSIPIKKTQSVESFLKPQPKGRLNQTLKESKSLKNLPTKNVKHAANAPILNNTRRFTKPTPATNLHKNKPITVVKGNERNFNKSLVATKNKLNQPPVRDNLKTTNRMNQLNVTVTKQKINNTSSGTKPLHFVKTSNLATNVKRLSLAKKTDAVNQTLIITNPTMNDLTIKLSDWLKHNGKSIEDFHHLKCFDHNTTLTIIDEEDKENQEPTLVASDSYEDLQCTPLDTEENKQVAIHLDLIAKDALLDLHKLILEGYSTEQCEFWLKLIKQKCTSIENDPQYWECRAALEQSRGNINLAVKYYKAAIVQGAEIQAVDQNLDQLLEKFSLLDIKTETCTNKERSRILEDARNIFKSSIIQFAVREKALKQKHKEGVTVEKKMVATPVRRSTRLSRSSAFTHTPGIKIYSSLQDIDDSVRCSLNFQCNKALKE